MQKQIATIATGLSLAAAGLMGQGHGIGVGTGVGEPMTSPFQQVNTMTNVRTYTFERNGAPITGSPLSAREVSRTTQTLSDGTQLDNTTTTLFYRDSQGRTRTEPVGANASITIVDPVAGVRIVLNPATKTATRMTASLASTAAWQKTEVAALAKQRAELLTTLTPDHVKVRQIDSQIAAQEKLLAAQQGQMQTVVFGKPQPETVDLGFQNQNGVLAQGTRTTITIPQGTIGNNRDIHVVNERWFSKDLQMLVKSINSDPRFGTTTFDLTNVVQSADPSLFQIPAGYTVNDLTGK